MMDSKNNNGCEEIYTYTCTDITFLKTKVTQNIWSLFFLFLRTGKEIGL